MIKFCRQNNKSVLEKLKDGNLDYAHISNSNLVDDIISTMNANGILQCLEDGIDDLRANNKSIPFKLILAFIIAAKMRQKFRLTDIPTAITDHRLLGELGHNLIDTDGKLSSALMNESGLRYLIDKFNPFDLFEYYNRVVQNFIIPRLNLVSHIHIIDCTTIEVDINKDFELSGILKINNKSTRGYKLATIRGIAYDTGFIEEIKFGQINIHDIDLCREMIMKSFVLKPGDILICDRGFIDRKLINYLKIYKGVSVYQPIKKGMYSFETAIEIAKMEKRWMNHPNSKRKSQKIAFVPNIGQYWHKQGIDDVELNACVVKDESTNQYRVFVTSDLSKNARDIIKTYALRPEVEEQYKQLKMFWGLEKLVSKKLNVTAFHMVFTLFAYLFYELYIMSSEGEEYAHKSLPYIISNFKNKSLEYIILYSGNEFAIMRLMDFFDIYASFQDIAKEKFKSVMDR